MFPWEYCLADKAYVGDDHCLAEIKGKTRNLRADQISYNKMIQFYRSRVEHAVKHIQKGHRVFSEKWRGSFCMIDAMTTICVHLRALQVLFEGPKYDIYGPWPHYPSCLA